MKLQNLLQGETYQAQQALDSFFATIDEERILWYPRTGKDYRDVMEITPERLALHQIPQPANIICHTDYHPDWTGLLREDYASPLAIHTHAHTTVEITEQHPLTFNFDMPGSRIRRHNPPLDDAAKRLPTIYLLKLNIQSDSLGEIESYVFYFMMENYRFLEQIILKKRLAITHFVKVRQGCGFGGCRKCISVFYSLLATIGVKYLLVDSEVWYDLPTHHRIARQHQIQHRNYRLQRIGMPLNWSGFHVHAFRLETLAGELDNDGFNTNLAEINKGWSERHPWVPKTFFPIQRQLSPSQTYHDDMI